jgi:hypothetical protein
MNPWLSYVYGIWKGHLGGNSEILESGSAKGYLRSKEMDSL